LAPISPYRLPLEKVTLISSKSGSGPNCMDMLLVVINRLLSFFEKDRAPSTS
jgi:hypothetical protein